MLIVGQTEHGVVDTVPSATSSSAGGRCCAPPVVTIVLPSCFSPARGAPPPAPSASESSMLDAYARGGKGGGPGTPPHILLSDLFFCIIRPIRAPRIVFNLFRAVISRRASRNYFCAKAMRVYGIQNLCLTRKACVLRFAVCPHATAGPMHAVAWAGALSTWWV
jgi:hypothetical protein